MRLDETNTIMAPVPRPFSILQCNFSILLSIASYRQFFVKSGDLNRLLKSAHCRGVNITPPPPDIRHSSETVLDIDMKLSVPYGTTILRLPWKFCANRTKNFWENDVLVTSCYAILGHKWTKMRSVVDCSILKQIANEKRRVEGNQIQIGFLNHKIP